MRMVRTWSCSEFQETMAFSVTDINSVAVGDVH